MDLCERIIKEQDGDRFTDLIVELEILLEFFHPAEEAKITSQ